MLRINLLPTKVSKKTTNAKNELYAVLGAVVLVLLALFLWDSVMLGKIEELEGRVSAVKKEIATLKEQTVKVDDFKNKAATLEQKVQVIESLQRAKVGPARMLDDLASILTDEKKVWLTGISEKEGNLLLEGEAMEHVNVSDFQIALSRRSKFFKNVRLDIVEAKKRDGIPVLVWKMTCKADYSAG